MQHALQAVTAGRGREGREGGLQKEALLYFLHALTSPIKQAILDGDNNNNNSWSMTQFLSDSALPKGFNVPQHSAFQTACSKGGCGLCSERMSPRHKCYVRWQKLTYRDLCSGFLNLLKFRFMDQSSEQCHSVTQFIKQAIHLGISRSLTHSHSALSISLYLVCILRWLNFTAFTFFVISGVTARFKASYYFLGKSSTQGRVLHFHPKHYFLSLLFTLTDQHKPLWTAWATWSPVPFSKTLRHVDRRSWDHISIPVNPFLMPAEFKTTFTYVLNFGEDAKKIHWCSPSGWILCQCCFSTFMNGSQAGREDASWSTRCTRVPCHTLIKL